MCNTFSCMGNSKPKQYSKTSLLSVDGEALTSARVNAQMSVGDVAKKLNGCNQSSVSRWEQGKLIPSQERIFALVEMYGTFNFVRLNGRAVLTAEEIEAVRKLRGE
jgi:predicted transcriptional regulator